LLSPYMPTVEQRRQMAGMHAAQPAQEEDDKAGHVRIDERGGADQTTSGSQNGC
jgi:hypothetical protein